MAANELEIPEVPGDTHGAKPMIIKPVYDQFMRFRTLFDPFLGVILRTKPDLP